MRLETFPLLLGGLMGLLGIALLFDAVMPDQPVAAERRRRRRRERDRFGELLVSLGTMAMAAAFLGRDTWRFSTVTVAVGAVLLLLGAARNAAYLRDVFARGARTSPAKQQVPEPEGTRQTTPRRVTVGR